MARGALAEHRVRYRLLVASLRGATLSDIGQGVEDATPVGPFTVIRKARFYDGLERSVEVDLYAVHEEDDGTDLMIEVKDWEGEPPLDAVGGFVNVKETLRGQLSRRTVFLFYSESGLGEDAAAMLDEAGVLVLDPAKLARFEGA